MKRSADILNELNEISPLMAQAGSANVFIVPEGYFETAPEVILAMAKNQGNTGSGLPEGYFDTLPGNILSKIEGTAAHELQQLSPFLAGIKKITPYEVPENYFEDKAAGMVLAVNETALPEILRAAGKSQPFEVPDLYFEQLAGEILGKVRAQSPAKVVVMRKRSTVILKYAAAAIFTGIAALGVYKYAGNNTTGITTAAVAAVEKKSTMSEQQFNETLNNLSEEDIMKYLEKNASEEDMVALSSGIDEKNLPDEEEYFTDETTLDKFLEDIDTKN